MVVMAALLPSGKILAQSRAYGREDDCRTVLTLVRRHSASAVADAAVGRPVQ